jgi:hypothetical protein
MKKILGMLGAIGLVATSSATVVSCGNSPAEDTTTYELLSGQIDNIKNYIEEGFTDFNVDKGTTYSDFFNYDNQDSSVYKEFITPTANTWRSADNADDINAELVNWSKDALTLVALQHQVNEAGKPTGEDKVLKTFSNDDKTSTLEDLYTGALSDAKVEEDGHETLAIKVSANVGGVDLGQDFFLTFTFATA